MIFWITLLSYVVGIITAWAFGKYMIAVAQRKAVIAAGWDFTIMFFAQVIVLTLWARYDDSVLVLLGYIFGNSTGTYLVTRFSKKESDA